MVIFSDFEFNHYNLARTLCRMKKFFVIKTFFIFFLNFFMDTKTKLGSKSIPYFHDNTLTTIKSSDFSERNVLGFIQKIRLKIDLKIRH